MGQTIYAALFALLLCGSAFSFGKAVSYDFILSRNGSITPISIAIYPGLAKNTAPGSGDYSVVVLDGNGTVLGEAKYAIDFWTQSDPPRESDEAVISGELKYYDTAARLELRKKSEGLYGYDFPEERACNGNGICEMGENAFSCPKDCNQTNDLICSPFADNVCDSYCGPGEDPDCGIAVYQRPGTPALPAFVGGCVFLAAFLGAAGVAWLAIDRAFPGKKPNKPKKRASRGR